MVIRKIAAIGAVILVLGILLTGIAAAATNITGRGWRELLNRSPVQIFSVSEEGLRIHEPGVIIIDRSPTYRLFHDYSVRIEDWQVIINLRNRTIIIR